MKVLHIVSDGPKERMGSKRSVAGSGRIENEQVKRVRDRKKEKSARGLSKSKDYTCRQKKGIAVANIPPGEKHIKCKQRE